VVSVAGNALPASALPYTGGFGAAGPAGSCGNPTAPVTELFVVNYDLNSDGQIDNATAGAAPPGSITTVGGVAGNETTNLALGSDMGFADLPLQDFQSGAINSDSFRNSDFFGAQVFKLIVNKNIAAKSDATKKIMLADPQVENLFTTRSQTGSVCSWDAVGGQSLAGGSDNVTICHRESGSGSRETFRNTWMLDAVGNKPEGQASTAQGVPDTGNCGAASGAGAQRLENGGNKGTQKTYIENPSGGDVSTCVATNANAIGYVDVARTNANWYAVPVLGVDPDSASGAADLATLVKCGQYPYWGALSGGDGARNAANVFATAHRSALKSLLVFPSNKNYLPLGSATTGVSFTKTRTAGVSGFKFIPTSCPGVANPPAAKP
jgi:ABC-type phosphate transport system substrate-binding protein